MIIETYSYPRAAVIGNPSDGYFGKTIAFVFSNFRASVQLYQTPELEIKPQRLDVTSYKNMQALVGGMVNGGLINADDLLED